MVVDLHMLLQSLHCLHAMVILQPTVFLDAWPQRRLDTLNTYAGAGEQHGLRPEKTWELCCRNAFQLQLVTLGILHVSGLHLQTA